MTPKGRMLHLFWLHQMHSMHVAYSYTQSSMVCLSLSQCEMAGLLVATIWYEMLFFNVRSKADMSQLKEPCKNGWAYCDALWEVNSGGRGPKTIYLMGVQIPSTVIGTFNGDILRQAWQSTYSGTHKMAAHGNACHHYCYCSHMASTQQTDQKKTTNCYILSSIKMATKNLF